MKKTTLLIFTILTLLSIVSIAYAADGYTSCLESIRDVGIAPASCFAKTYSPLNTFNTAACTGATGSITVGPLGNLIDSNDAAAVGASCPNGCLGSEQNSACTAQNGQIVVDMGAGGLVTLAGTTTDLYINEGGVLEPFSAYYLDSANKWQPLGYSCAKSHVTVRGENFYEFNIPGAANLAYRYIKINVTKADATKQCDGSTVCTSCKGSDIGWVLSARVECTNECSSGSRGCDDSNTQWTCGEANDGDTCLDKISTDCSSGNACTDPPGSCSSTCIPKTCTQLGKECGSWSDTCGGTVTCGNNGACTAPGNYCTTTGQCNQLLADTTFTCSGASGTLTAETAVPATIQLKYYAGNLAAQTQTLPKNGPFTFTIPTPFADDASHTFRLAAIISDAASEYELARQDLVCPSTPSANCQLKNVDWNTTCVGAGLPVRLSGETVTPCPQATTVNFEVWEKDTGPDDHMRPDPAADTIQPTQSRFSTEWNASWQDDEFSKDPTYYAKAISTQNTITTNGTALTVKPCALNLDSDCDGVVNSLDRCAGTSQCTSVDSNGCEHSGQQQLCDALWDCSALSWSTCTDGKVTRNICKEGSGGTAPTCCTNLNNYANQCACVFTGNNTQFNLCQQYAPETQRSCLVEEEFPIFTWINALLVSVLLAGYYIVRRKY